MISSSSFAVFATSAVAVLMILLLFCTGSADGALGHSDEQAYLDNFDAMDQASYAEVDDDGHAPPDLLPQCKKGFVPWIVPTRTVVVVAPSPTAVLYASNVASQCGLDAVCILPAGLTLRMDASLNLGALIVRGRVEWNDATTTMGQDDVFLCAGYVAVEDQGVWDMHISAGRAWIYLKDNGAEHAALRTRAFGAVGGAGHHGHNSGETASGNGPSIQMRGRELTRTWSLVAKPLQVGDVQLSLLHHPTLMGWNVGDRIGVAPTQPGSTGYAQTFDIVAIDDVTGTVTLNHAAASTFDAHFAPPDVMDGQPPLLKSAEVVNLSRSIVITGDDFTHIPCNPNLPEAVRGEETSVEGCRCSSFRTTCTIGLHTALMHTTHASQRMEHVRVEKCGQRGVEGKYCLHLHKLGDCPNCVLRNNAIENSHQRGIIVHSTHRALVENNVLYNVRGAGLYLEDGNELGNTLRYNVVICPFPFGHTVWHGCTVPGTSNRIADTADNQAGIFSRAAGNNLIGNRVANSFNGMLLQAGGLGRGESYGKVCESDNRFGRIEGNTWHGASRFGTYTLGFNYPKRTTDQSIASNGHNVDQSLCRGFDPVTGETRGAPAAFLGNTDYDNVFVGHYEAGDLQYYGHHSHHNLNLLYWKETKNMQDGCAAHVSRSSFSHGTLALPDQGTFLMEHTVMDGDSVLLEANHHCGVGLTGVLCMPQYVLHNVTWKTRQGMSLTRKWVEFQSLNFQPHNYNQNHGGIFTLSPPDAERAMIQNGGDNDNNSLFPPGFVSLVSSKFHYLLDTPNNQCVLSSSLGLGQRYHDGILCRIPLRALKLYSRGLQSAHHPPDLSVRVQFADGTVASQSVGFHQIGADYASPKQGYSIPVIPGTEHVYELSLSTTNLATIPPDWVVEFSDPILGHRWGTEFLRIHIPGRGDCGSNHVINSQHDRRFLWSGDEFMHDQAWGHHGACVGQGSPPPDEPGVDCGSGNPSMMIPMECPGLCGANTCGSNAYCDCTSQQCHCHAGFAGPDCSVDLCAAARCGAHGTCAARYLSPPQSSVLPVTSPEAACICDDGWSGPLCQFNPCVENGDNVFCSGNGSCVATFDNRAICECNPGYSGDQCEQSCHNICPGPYPFGCATNIAGAVQYGCTAGGGCHYLQPGQSYPSGGFCTFLTSEINNNAGCNCGPLLATMDCTISGHCDSNGQCLAPIVLENHTPCNSVPFGVCMDGICVEPNNNTPKHSCECLDCTETFLDTTMAGEHTCGERIAWLQTPEGGLLSEHEACTLVAGVEFGGICGPQCDPSRCNKAEPTQEPTRSPSKKPSSAPSRAPTLGPTGYCGCPECSDFVLDTLAGEHTCRSRIEWLQTPEGGLLSEHEACRLVAGIEFDDICGPRCDPSRCNQAEPTQEPTRSPSTKPSAAPSKAPTLGPTRLPSMQPTNSPTTTPKPTNAPTATPPCGCPECTNEFLSNTMAVSERYGGSHSCGDRIAYLQSPAGGSQTEHDACLQIAAVEFPNVCGPYCDPGRCVGGGGSLRKQRHLRSDRLERK